MIDRTREPVILVWCRKCGKPNAIHGIDLNDLDLWQSGLFITDAMPYLDENERELLISATCKGCWDIMFPDLEDE